MLRGNNIKIFQITDRKRSDLNSIELSLDKPVAYLQSEENKIYLVNEPPFRGYKVGDYLAVDLDRTRFLSPNAERGKIWSNSAMVAKVVKTDKPIPPYHKTIYKSEDFGDGWIEE